MALSPFIKRTSIPVRAEQYLPGQTWPEGMMLAEPFDPDGRPFVSSVHGPLRVNATDWVIHGRPGDVYPCADGVFKTLYVEVPEADPVQG